MKNLYTRDDGIFSARPTIANNNDIYARFDYFEERLELEREKRKKLKHKFKKEKKGRSGGGDLFVAFLSVLPAGLSLLDTILGRKTR